MARKGICIGINYAGTEFELNGCINDADDWARFLAGAGFEVSVLAERSATRQEIMLTVGRLVSSLKAGDVGFVQFSGHGTWVPDLSGDEPDGRDEALVPIDTGDDGTNLILDDELRELYGDIPRGATLVVVADCCHSGSAFRFAPARKVGQRRVRFLPPAHFARDARLTSRVERAYSSAPVRKTNAAIPGVVFFSGCRDVEYSNDAYIDGRYCGAFSHAAIPAFREVLARQGTYRDVYGLIRQQLPNWEFQQTPLLSATPARRAAKVFS